LPQPVTPAIKSGASIDASRFTLEADYRVNGRKSTKDMLGRVARLREKFGKVRAVDITHKLLLAYVDGRTAEGACPATVRYEVMVLGRMYSLAIRAGMLTSRPPLPTINVRNTRSGFFEPDQVARLSRLHRGHGTLRHDPATIWASARRGESSNIEHAQDG